MCINNVAPVYVSSFAQHHANSAPGGSLPWKCNFYDAVILYQEGVMQLILFP